MPVQDLNTKDAQIADAAAAALERGERVVYVALGSQHIRPIMDRIVGALPRRNIQRVSYGRGDECIRTRNGGKIIFRSSNTSGPRGLTADTLLLDEVSDAIAEYAQPIVAESEVAQIHRWFRGVED